LCGSEFVEEMETFAEDEFGPGSFPVTDFPGIFLGLLGNARAMDGRGPNPLRSTTFTYPFPQRERTENDNEQQAGAEEQNEPDGEGERNVPPNLQQQMIET
jgi:hypothetical protein